jgi:hypothetical protein
MNQTFDIGGIDIGEREEMVSAPVISDDPIEGAGNGISI